MARLWWNKFVQATDAKSAFAAWHVFLSCADRRAYLWMKQDADKTFTGSELDRLRALHVQMNRSQLERKLLARQEKVNGLNSHLFGREVPAHWLEKGVETKELYDLLKEEHCEAFQGYYFSRPLPIEQVQALIMSQSFIADQFEIDLSLSRCVAVHGLLDLGRSH